MSLRHRFTKAALAAGVLAGLFVDPTAALAAAGPTTLPASDYTLTAGYNQFDSTPGELCPTIRSDVPWLSEDPTSGSLDPDSSTPVQVTVDASSLAEGSYRATLIIPNTDPAVPELHVPVHLTVTPPPTAEYIGIGTFPPTPFACLVR